MFLKEKLLATGLFQEVDFAFAEMFDGVVEKKEKTFLAYLFALSRFGYHSVTIDENTIYPELFQNFKEEDKALYEKELREGAASLKEGVCQNSPKSIDLRPVVKVENTYFLQKYYSLEKEIRALFQNHLKEEKLEDCSIANLLEPYQKVLNEKQLQAVVGAIKNKLFLLSGGPGTGKTHTIRHFLEAFLDLKKDNKVRILAAAPTGKATSHLKEKLSHIKGLDVKTLHKALSIRGNQIKQKTLLNYDVIVVDECSMIDLYLWKSFLKNVQPFTKVLLVGDYHQLPPVETGMVFEELFKSAEDASIELEECLRIEKPAIHALAEAVKNNERHEALKILHEKNEGIEYLEFDERASLHELLDITRLFSHFKETQEIKTLLEGLKKVCLLSPLNKGPFGTYSLNEEIYQTLKGQAASLAVPIMIVQTDYDKKLYNGDLGILLEDGTSSPKAYFLLDNEVASFDEYLLPKYEKAYCTTVHKAQGSEFDDIYVFLPEKSELFGKQVLYTAITRCKKSCHFFAKKDVVEKCFLAV